MDAKKKIERRHWLSQKSGNKMRPKSVDRGFISLQSPAGIGATDSQAAYDDLTRTASLEQGSEAHRIDQDPIREVTMNSAFVFGFLDELEKQAKKKMNILEKGEDIVRTVKRHATVGAGRSEGTGKKIWGGIKGGYKGVKKSFKKHPGMFLAPAAAYAGYELLKAVKGGDEDER
jgi:hypothetical protein